MDGMYFRAELCTVPQLGKEQNGIRISTIYSLFYLLLLFNPIAGYGIDVDVFPNRYAHEFPFEKMVGFSES